SYASRSASRNQPTETLHDFRLSWIPQKTTQNIKTHANDLSYLLYSYSAIAPDCSITLTVVDHVLIYQRLCYNYFNFIRRRINILNKKNIKDSQNFINSKRNVDKLMKNIYIIVNYYYF